MIALLGLGWLMVPVAAGVAVVTLLWGLIARAKIGGKTGDILGASQQLAEIVALACLCSALAG